MVPRPPDDARSGMRQLARGAERISSMILDGECEAVDIAINNLRDEAEALFAMIYEGPFDRLRQQFPGGLWG